MTRFLLLLFPALAFAQTSGSVNIDSVRSPFSVKATYSLTLQTESLNALTGKLVANAGQVAKVGAVDLIKQTFILAEIPGPKTVGAKTVVASVKATWIIAGGVGWFADPLVVHVTPLNIEVPAGHTLAIRYDMPIQSPTLALAPGSFAWLVGVGVKATDIPAPVIGPTSGGTITPPPPPPPAPGTSPDCTKVPPAAQLVDELGATWTSGVRDPNGTAPGQVAIFRTRPGTSTTDRIYGGAEFVQVNAGRACASDFLSGTGWECWDAATGKMVHTDTAPPACP